MNSLISLVSYVDLPEDPGFATYFSHLARNRTCTDVTFVLETPDGEIEVYAHKLILAMRSSYFADKFYGNQKNNEHETIRLKRIDRKAFEDMIRYCYGCKPGLDTTEEACALFKLANQYEVISLMNLCRTCLRDIRIEPGNVFSMLEVSKYTKDQSLRDKCDKLIEDNTREVIAAYDLRDVTSSMVHIILKMPKLSLYNEYELIKWLFDWAKIKCEEDFGFGCTRDYMEKLLQEMSFLALTFEEFAELCKDNPDFFSSDEIASVYLNIAFPGTKEMPDFYDKELKIRPYTGRKI